MNVEKDKCEKVKKLGGMILGVSLKGSFLSSTFSLFHF